MEKLWASFEKALGKQWEVLENNAKSKRRTVGNLWKSIKNTMEKHLKGILGRAETAMDEAMDKCRKSIGKTNGKVLESIRKAMEKL